MSAPYNGIVSSVDCLYCQTPIPAGRRDCPKCGTPASGLDDVPTRLAGSPPSTSPSVWSGSGDTVVPGQVLGGRFSILAPLGGGGMGQVYEALDQELGVTVALKFLNPEIAADEGMGVRFRGEVRLAREISHPNVARTFDLGEIDGRRFLSMEYVPGADLRTVLRWAGAVRPRQLLRIGREVCAGLRAVHRAGILHGDLKPGNVLLDRQGRVKLTDFGLARFAAGPGGHGVGTPAYMAPEQFETGSSVDERADLYSLGVMLYEMATGKTPFRADTLSEWSRAHREEAPIPPRRIQADIEPALDEVILRCLEKRPEDRFADLAALDAALDALQQGLPLASLLPEKTWVLQAGRRRIYGLLATSVLLLVAGLASTLVPGPGMNLWARMPLDLPPDAAAERVRGIADEIGGADLPPGRPRVRVEGSTPALRAASAAPGPDRYAPLISGAIPALRYRVTIDSGDGGEAPEWPFSGEPVLLDESGKAEVVLDRPGDVYAELSGRGEVLRFFWWPPALEEQDDPHGLAFRLAGLDPEAFRDTGRVERNIGAGGGVVTRTYERIEPVLGESEKLKIVYWRRGPPAAEPEATGEGSGRPAASVADAGEAARLTAGFLDDASRGLLLHVERIIDFGSPALPGDLKPLHDTRAFVGGLIILAALGLAALIWTLVHAWQRRAVVVGRNLVLGLVGGALYLGMSAFIGAVSQGLTAGRLVATVLGSTLTGVLFGLLLAMLLAATEAAGSIWMPRAMVGWQRLLSRGLRDPQVAVETVIGFGATGALLLAISGWEALRSALGLPLAIQPDQALPLLSKPLVTPLFLADQIPWCLFYGFALMGLFALARRLVGQGLTAAGLVVLLVTAAYLAFIQSSWDLFHSFVQLGIGMFVLSRWGLVALMSYVFFLSVNAVVPLGVHEGAPFSSASAMTLAIETLAVLALVLVSVVGVHRHGARSAAATA